MSDAKRDEAARAYAELGALLEEIEAQYFTAERRTDTPAGRAAARYLVANALQHGFQCWFEADAMRPTFQKWLGPTKKMLGDNPDAVYYGAVVDPTQRYRIRGNIQGACYTSFAGEAGARDGNLSQGVLATLNDDEFDVEADGSYELIASAKPQPRNWLALAPTAGSITTRHYWEWERSPAADPGLHVPLWIENLDDPGPAPPMDDAAIAAGVRRVINFVRGITLGFPVLPPEIMPAWVSNEVNRFSPPEIDGESNKEIGYAAVDNDYRQTVYEIGLDEALIMRGEFPRCRFANVVLWNHRLQTPPYIGRKVSLNRRQIRPEADGRFEIFVAHRDPGVPNWLDAAGLESGMIFWRFLMAETTAPNIETELVKLGEVARP